VEAATDPSEAPSELRLDRPGDATLLVRVAGSWTLKQRTPEVAELEQAIGAGPSVERIRFDAGDLASWDSALYLISDCANSGTTCVAGEDAGDPEEIDFTNGGTEQTYYLVVDSFIEGANFEGNYELTVDFP